MEIMGYSFPKHGNLAQNIVRQKAGNDALREVTATVNNALQQGKRGLKEAGIEPLNVYDSQVQCCEYIKRNR